MGTGSAGSRGCHTVDGRTRTCARARLYRLSTLCNPMAPGLCLGPDMRPRYLTAPSVAVHSIMSLRSAHLPGVCDYVYGSMERPRACPLALCDMEMNPPCDAYEFCFAADIEHRWRHIEHIAFGCPCVTPPGLPQSTCVDLLRADLLFAAGESHVAQLAVRNAFPDGGQGVDAACATAVSAPFLLDPAASILATGLVPGGVANVCVRLVAGFLVGLAARVCGGAAVPFCGGSSEASTASRVVRGRLATGPVQEPGSGRGFGWLCAG